MKRISLVLIIKNSWSPVPFKIYLLWSLIGFSIKKNPEDKKGKYVPKKLVSISWQLARESCIRGN